MARRTYRKMVENLLRATGYNAVAIPLAAGVLYGSEALLSPAVGTMLMSLSTVIIALNAQRLRAVTARRKGALPYVNGVHRFASPAMLPTSSAR